jgi:tellurite resistance protein TerC
VLFWGVLGALVMRGVMILVGAELIARVHWIIYLFGGFLIFTGVRMLFHDEDAGDPSDNIAVRAVRRFVPVTPDYHGEHFFVRMPASPELAAAGSVSGARLRRYATPLFLVLVCIEFTDLVFAVDSIPAIFGITQDPFIVFTSNVFAILGLRSMYFLLAGVMNRFHYLKIGLSAVLTFVGVKMLLPAAGAWVDKDQMIEKNFSWLFSIDPHGHHHWHIRIPLSLGFIVLTLTASVVASLVWPKAEPDGALPPTDVPDEGEGAHHADIP